MDAEGAEVLRRLQELLTRAGSVQILFGSEVCSGVIAAIRGQVATFHLEEDLPHGAFDSKTFCAVIFSEERETRVFHSLVRYFDPPALGLELPSKIAKAEGRQAFRVPIHDGSGLSVQVTESSRKWTTRPINVSLGGTLIEFPESDVPDLPIGAKLEITLTLNEERIVLPSVVRHRLGERCYGVDFSTIEPGGTMGLPSSLRNMVRALRRHWMDTRNQAGILGM